MGSAWPSLTRLLLVALLAIVIACDERSVSAPSASSSPSPTTPGPGPSPGPSPSGPITVSGTVTGAPLGESIAGVRVEATHGGDPDVVTTSNDSGAFRLAGLSAQEYVIHATKN